MIFPKIFNVVAADSYFSKNVHTEGVQHICLCIPVKHCFLLRKDKVLSTKKYSSERIVIIDQRQIKRMKVIT